MIENTERVLVKLVESGLGHASRAERAVTIVVHRRRETSGDVGRRVVFPAQTQIQREAPRDFKIVLREDSPLLIDLLAQSLPLGRDVIPITLSLVRAACDPVILGNTGV